RPPGSAECVPYAERVPESRGAEVAALLDCLDSDCGYDDWLRALMVVHHETDGSDAGLALVDAWSARGRKYRGRHEVERKWRSFRHSVETPYAMPTLMWMVAETGVDPVEVC